MELDEPLAGVERMCDRGEADPCHHLDLARLDGLDVECLPVGDRLRRRHDDRSWSLEQVGRREDLGVPVGVGRIVLLPHSFDGEELAPTRTQYPAIGKEYGGRVVAAVYLLGRE